MATSIAFAPTASAPFSFGATFDGGNYICTVTWNLYRQGWYLNVFDTTSTLIFSKALVPAPPNPPAAMNMLFGYFTTSTLFLDDAAQTFVITP